MKNLMSILTIATLLIFTSCTKEELIQPENLGTQEVELVTKNVQESDAPITVATRSNFKGNEIEVDVASNFSTPTELNIDFTSSHDFTNESIESTQAIDFIDGNQNTVTITFTVNSYTGGNGTLDVSLAIGGNDLSGLQIKGAQIIISDEVAI